MPGGEDGAAVPGADATNGAAAAAAEPGPSTAPPPQQPEPTLDDDALLAAFFADVKAADRDAEVERVLGAFKLNPYEQVGVRFDASPAEVTRAYRKSSLLVHPDKCAHPRAQDAFEVLNAAVAALRGEGPDGEAKLKELTYVLQYSKDQVLAAKAAASKKDAVVRLASAVTDGGAAAVQAAWEASDAFHEAWREKARDVLARTAFKRQKLVARLKEAAHREEEEEARAAREVREAAKVAKQWEKDREARVGSWRAFARGGGGGEGGGGEGDKKKKKKAVVAAPAAGALPFGVTVGKKIAPPARPAGGAAAAPPPLKRARSSGE